MLYYMLLKIPTNMPLRERYFLLLKEQRNLSDLLVIALQPFFSKLAAICHMTLSYRVAGCPIDFVQGCWQIAEPLTYFLQRGRRIFCTACCLLK